jgi:hypothetical protein
VGKALFYVGCGIALVKMARWARIKALTANIDKEWRWVSRG